MAMLRSAIGLALRQSAPASRFCGNVGRRNPPSNITTTRQYYSSNYELCKDDFTGWNGPELMFASFAIAVALVFRHNTSPRYNKAHCETKSSADTCQNGREKTEQSESNHV